MATDRLQKTSEQDIFSVIREIERRPDKADAVEDKKDTLPAATEVSEKDVPDAKDLLNSLKLKRDFVKMISKFPEADPEGIDEMKTKLNDAIGFLEDFLKSSPAEKAE